MHSFSTPAPRQTGASHSKTEKPSTFASTHHQTLTRHRGFSPAHSIAADNFPPFIQAKLTIGGRHDKYEQEADRVSDAVMRMPESEIQLKPT